MDPKHGAFRIVYGPVNISNNDELYNMYIYEIIVLEIKMQCTWSTRTLPIESVCSQILMEVEDEESREFAGLTQWSTILRT